MYETYCDHTYVREDQLTKQCIKCGAYVGVKKND